ncbi:MAG: LCCL domain-containing protein [Deltaproteobacteria bacterium]|nr:LCCL domain-containing protein [Deltaproteobacteria bacterium]
MADRSVWLGSLVTLTLTSAALGSGCKRSQHSQPQPAVRMSLELRSPFASRESPTPSDSRAVTITWETPAQTLGTLASGVIRVNCLAGAPTARLWGTDLYTADSSVCTAAVHSGRLDPAVGGELSLLLITGVSHYRGSTRMAVASREFGQFGLSFAFVGGPAMGLAESTPRPAEVAPWRATMQAHRGQQGARVRFECPAGGTAANVWGTDIYTDDSSVCSAAVHAGLLTVAEGGTVEAIAGRAMESFAASTRNEITTLAFGNYAGSFVFDAGMYERLPHGPEGTESLGWGSSAASHRGSNGQSFRVWCPPNGTKATVWGTGVYTDDSSVCTAAVHAGLVTLAQGGVFSVRPLPGRARYAGSTRNGVASVAYEAFAGSFALSR